MISNFNTRVIELFRNKFIIQTATLEALESFMVFGFGFWVYYFLFVEMGIEDTCLKSNASSPMVCSKFFLLFISFLILITLSLASYFLSKKGSFMNSLWIGSSILALIVGIIGISVTKIGNFTAILISLTSMILYCSKTMTKLYHVSEEGIILMKGL